ncbi:MAG TPA: lysophospholipid acyltransferase family protein [Anaerolineae bacterium]
MTAGRRIPLGRRFWQPILRFLVGLFLRIEMRGSDCIPAGGAGIIYYNHIHWLDPPLICATSPRYAVPLTKIEASRFPFVGLLLKWYHVIFITRGAVDRDALKATWQVLADGDISVISPEGTRSLDGRLVQAKEGLAFIARQAPDAWLIPCGVTGTPAFVFKFPQIFQRPHVTLTYGRPFRLRWPEDGRAGRDVQREMTDEAMYQLAACLPPAMRGDYAVPPQGEPRWLEFLAP